MSNVGSLPPTFEDSSGWQGWRRINCDNTWLYKGGDSLRDIVFYITRKGEYILITNDYVYNTILQSIKKSTFKYNTFEYVKKIIYNILYCKSEKTPGYYDHDKIVIEGDSNQTLKRGNIRVKKK